MERVVEIFSVLRWVEDIDCGYKNNSIKCIEHQIVHLVVCSVQETKECSLSS